MRGVVHHHETFHARAVDQQRQVVGRALDRFLVVVLADGAADHHAGLEVQAAEYRVEDVAANVVEIHVHAFRAFALEAGEHVFVLVVDGTVKAQFVDQELTLVRTTGNTHHAAAFELGNLPGNAANGTGGTRQHHGIPGPRCANVQQGEVGGHAGHAQRRQIARQGRQFRIDLVETTGLADEVVLHTQRAVHIVTHGKARVVGGDDLAHTQGTHDLADAHGRDVGLAFVHPATHGRVQRQVFVLDQDLTGRRFPDRNLLIGKGLAGRGPHRAFGEQELTVGLGSHGGHSRVDEV
ncbi:hypothetical protein D3C84_333210 [compost metagenome]